MTSTPIDLGDNLILRSATIDDAEQVASLNEYVHGDIEKGELEKPIGAWTRDLFRGYNSEIQPSDWTVVEDTSTGKIVSTMCLMPQIWNIAGIETPVGQIEIVGTHPDYRRRGLIRQQFDLMHQWSDSRGDLISAVLGIPNYYRQFGYEMGLDAEGGSTTSVDLLDQVKLDESDNEVFTWRDVTRDDIEAVTEIYESIHDRAFISVKRNRSIVEKELFNTSPENVFNWKGRLLERSGAPVAYYVYATEDDAKRLRVDQFEISPRVNWFDASRNFLVDLQTVARGYPEPESGALPKIQLNIGSEHPIFNIYSQPLGVLDPPYYWYLRVPDLPKLVMHLKPVFEQRLVGSEFDSWTGELLLSFYRDGMSIKFENGEISSAEFTGAIQRAKASALFPDLTFLQVLFGNRSIEQMKVAYRDAYASSKAMESLIGILFGRRGGAAITQVS